MELVGEYEPSSQQWVRDQVELFESTSGSKGNTIRGAPIVVLTMVGARSRKIRKTPLMRVNHDGRYAAVASVGGRPKHPQWYFNLLANPRLELQDGAVKREMVAREVFGEEKARWWELAVAAFPDYAEYQARTDRLIPVFELAPTDD